MNQLTTIASLPSGSGRASSLPAEVGEPRKPAIVPMSDYFKEQQEACLEWPNLFDWIDWNAA